MLNSGLQFVIVVVCIKVDRDESKRQSYRIAVRCPVVRHISGTIAAVTSIQALGRHNITLFASDIMNIGMCIRTIV